MSNTNNKKEIIVNRYFKSNEMKQYLLNQNLKDIDLVNIILGSTDDLEEKLYLIKQHFDINKLDNYGHEYTIDLLVKGTNNWKRKDNNAIFLLTSNWLDEDILEEKHYNCGIFKNSKQVIEFIRKEMKINESEGLQIEEWYEAEKWVLNEQGKYEKTHSFTLVDDRVCFWDRYVYNEKFDCFMSISRMFKTTDFDERLKKSSYLNLPVPYEVGDLIKIDCEPFAPIKPAIIVEKSSNVENLGVQVLYRNEDGKYKINALKSSHMFIDDYQSLLFPLYKLSYYDKNEEIDYLSELLEKGRIAIDYIKRKGHDSHLDDILACS